MLWLKIYIEEYFIWLELKQLNRLVGFTGRTIREYQYFTLFVVIYALSVYKSVEPLSTGVKINISFTAGELSAPREKQWHRKKLK